jgi:hypothetical protein
MLERLIRRTVKDTTSWDWDEDFITRSILSNLRNEFDDIQLQGRDDRKKLQWQAYKLLGKHETNFGDIALLINIFYKDGTHLEGAAFLEAKKRDRRKTSFSAMRAQQLKRILKHAPRAQYLLYDYEDITGFQAAPVFMNDLRHFYLRHEIADSLVPRTSAVCVPMDIAGATGFKDTLLYRYGTPLSMMLASRYFQGLDLDFSKEALGVASGFLAKFGHPKYVLEVTIFENGSEPSSKTVKVNPQSYVRMD